MSQNSKEDLDEKRIKELFREMRQQDGLATPSFTNVLQSQASEPNSNLGLFLRLAAIASILILISTAAVLLSRYKSQPVASIDNDKKHEERMVDQPPPASVPSAIAPQNIGYPVVYKPKKRIVKHHQLLISQWRSPTDFLLQTSGDKLLKTVPQLIDPALKFNVIVPDEKN